MTLEMVIGTGEYPLYERREERTYCPRCAFDQQVGPTMRRAAKLLKRGR